MQCSLDGDTVLHESGLRTMPQPHAGAVHLTAPLPARCCPVSGNPRAGSTLTLRYRPQGRVLETYSLDAVLKRFVGGFPGAGRYRAERNMEGMVHLVAQMAADALRVRVRYRADIRTDTGAMAVSGVATPGGGAAKQYLLSLCRKQVRFAVSWCRVLRGRAGYADAEKALRYAWALYREVQTEGGQ